MTGSAKHEHFAPTVEIALYVLIDLMEVWSLTRNMEAIAHIVFLRYIQFFEVSQYAIIRHMKRGVIIVTTHTCLLAFNKV